MARKQYTWKIDPATLHEARVENGRKAQAARWANPDAHEAASEVMRERWQDPAYRAERHETAEAMRERLSIAGKARWNKPGSRERHGEKMAAAWTPERRAAQAQRVKERLATPGAREKAAEAMRRVWRDPTHRETVSTSMTARWNDPDYQELQRALHADPERRANWSAKARAQWDRMTPEEQAESLRRAHSAISPGSQINKLEARVLMVLNDMDRFYKVHQVVGPYAADILLAGEPKVDVECDGAYWHGRREEHDATRDAWFTANGYRVIRVPEDADEAVIRGLIEGIG